MIELGPEADGTVATADVGATVVVRLPENPTTGHRWTPVDFDESVLALDSATFEPPSDATPGAGGMRVLRFVATAPGTTAIRLVHGRPWETGRRSTGSPGPGEICVTVEVRGPSA